MTLLYDQLVWMLTLDGYLEDWVISNPTTEGDPSMIALEALILALHDGAKAAERHTLPAVLHTMADTLVEYAQDPSARRGTLQEIYEHGSQNAPGHRY